MSISFLKNLNGDVVEGFIDARNPKAEVLFLLKEPHTENVENDNGFWLKECVWRAEQSQNSAETKYINVLGKLAGAVLGKKVSSFDECKNILKSCAYINLYPFSGGSSESADFTKVLKSLEGFSGAAQFNDISKENSTAEEIAANRLAIVCDLIRNHKCRYVITPGNIFYALRQALGGAETKCWMEYEKKDKKFSYFEYEGAKILEFWHPAYTYISNEFRDNFKKHLKIQM